MLRRLAALAMTLAAAPACAAPETPAAQQPGAATQADTKPYDGPLLHLSEVLGALAYLRELCADKDAAQWQKRMQSLLDAEGTSAARRSRLAGAFNSGIAGYQLSYRTCTPNARLATDRLQNEAAQISHAVENRFGTN